MYNAALSRATGNKFKITKFLLQVATWAMRELHFSPKDKLVKGLSLNFMNAKCCNFI